MSWLQLVQALSTDVVARMSTSGLPPLVDGAILFGPEHEWENSAPPRIVMIPISSEFGVRRDAPRGGVKNPLAPGAGVLFATMVTQGKGYTSATAIFAAPPTGVRATGTAVVNAGAVQRVIMTNPGSGYLTAPACTITGTGTGATVATALQPSAELLSEISQSAIHSEKKKFRVSVWGCTYAAGVAAPDPAADFDATEAVYDVIIQSCMALFGQGGGYTLGRGLWVSSLPNATKLDMMGRMYTFELTLATPVTRVSLGFVPVGTLADPTVQFQPQDGAAPEAN
jgi:hypothetical protein